jgi:hypothetical protein
MTTVTAKPTITSVTAALVAAGWPFCGRDGDGIKVESVGTPGIVRVDYVTGPLPVNRDDALAKMAEVLRGKGWFVTESDRLLVSGG